MRLPSRNWLIFLSITGTWTGLLLYDRDQARRAQRKWAGLVSHLAQEPLASNSLQRRITIFLAAPPGDGLRVAREHFHEYIKPILVAGAVDWDVIEGRQAGDVRVGLADKIRQMRSGTSSMTDADEERRKTEERTEAVRAVREAMGVREWPGVKGDLILGRHTWKEYIRGLHEGWLGPLELPQDTSLGPDADPAIPEEAPDKTKKPDDRKPPKKAYIDPHEYSQASLAQQCPPVVGPSISLPMPHVLGFLNTPKRMYRFLTKRHLVEETGAQVAALVLAAQSVPLSADMSAVLLEDAEPDWHKSAWTNSDDDVWQQEMTIDSRISQRMQHFQLPPTAAQQAEELLSQNGSSSWWTTARDWLGYGPRPKYGWEMGLEGTASD